MGRIVFCGVASTSRSVFKSRTSLKPESHVLGIPLYESITISLTNGKGKSFVYGHVPIYVGKIGTSLKQKVRSLLTPCLVFSVASSLLSKSDLVLILCI